MSRTFTGTEDNFHDVVSEAKVVEPFFAEPDGRGRQDSGHLCFNLLHTSERDVILCDLQNAHFLGSSINKVYCKGAIHQAVPPGLGFISQTERLNMVFQVPELGMIAIGSPAGRVGLFTMTTWQAPKQPGYKIECILPFKSQEEKGMRPTKLLMGMAIGPIQGQETAPPPGSTQSTSHGATRKTPCTAHSTKRFRLFLTYYDHTILSYEISRPTAQDDILVV